MTSWLPVILPTSASVRELSATELNEIFCSGLGFDLVLLGRSQPRDRGQSMGFAMLEEVFGESETGKEGATDDPV